MVILLMRYGANPEILDKEGTLYIIVVHFFYYSSISFLIRPLICLFIYFIHPF